MEQDTTPKLVVVGIDPGLSGAVAVLALPLPISVWRLPTINIHVGKKNRRELDVPELLARLRGLPAGPTVVGLEWAQTFPKMGVVGAFNYGEVFGVLRGVLASLGLRYVKIRPQEWKPIMLRGRSGRDKGDARALAGELFPGVDLGRRSDEGISEALLIAEYTLRNHTGPVGVPTLSQDGPQPDIVEA